jgi:kynureninase
MPIEPEPSAPPDLAGALSASPNLLAPHYSRFRVADRLLLTGHSHQAWPDVSFEAQQRAWLDAADLVDEKWDQAAAQADRVRAGYRRLLGDPDGDIALGQNTHELVTRLLSALPLVERPRLVTTDAEFHTIRRQLDRLREAGLDVVLVAGRPVDTVADRMAGAIDRRTACALISSVYFETAEIVPNLDIVARACARHGAAFLVDAYHHLNAVPFDLTSMGLANAFVTGGGYKYCQLGEGNCFLRMPPRMELRPVLTGWFSEFATRSASDARESAPRARPPERSGVWGPRDRRRRGVRGAKPLGSSDVRYGEGPARLAGATYDPTSHYRAAAVFEFHLQMRLTPQLLREVSRHQIGVLMRAFDALDADPSVALVEPVAEERRAGFLAIRSPHARGLSEALRTRGVYTDFRGDFLRFGPAPYLCDDQLTEAMAHFGQVLRTPHGPWR